MYNPVYSLNPKLLNNINEIERLYGRLEGMIIPQSLILNLERNNLIKSSYASNSIEGNPLSQVDVTNLLLNDRVPVNRDEKEVVNYFHVLKTLDARAKQPLSLSQILDVHKDLMSGVDDENKGKIRNKEVIIGSHNKKGEILIKHNPPFHEKHSIEKALDELIAWINKDDINAVLKAGIFHHQFVYIHPFIDGNGRTARLITAMVFLRHNYSINKYFVLDDYYDIDRDNYSNSLHSADSGDKTKWLEYFTDGVKFSLKSALGRIETGLTQLSFDMRPSAREQEALKIVQKYRQVNTADLVRELKITRQQAFNLLKALVEKGFIDKKGTTKDSYYILKNN